MPSANEKLASFLRKVGLERALGTMVTIADYLFICVPVVVFCLVLKIKGQSSLDILALPEWTLLSSIMTGQTITKIVATVARNPHDPKHTYTLWELLVLVIAFLIVIILLPDVLTLALIIYKGRISVSLIDFQTILFVVNSLLFLFFGAATYDNDVFGKNDAQ